MMIWLLPKFGAVMYPGVGNFVDIISVNMPAVSPAKFTEREGSAQSPVLSSTLVLKEKGCENSFNRARPVLSTNS